MGEQILPFETYGGNVTIEPSQETLTPFGGLTPWAAFLKKTGIVEQLDATSPVKRTSPNALPVRDIIHSFMLTALGEGKHFSDVSRFGYDASIVELFGIKRIVSDDTIRRFFLSLPVKKARDWINSAGSIIQDILPSKYILDWDSTVITRYGEQEDAEIGYNPTKKGRRSHHPLLAVVSGARLCLHYTQRPGNTASSTDCIEAMEETLSNLKPQNHPWLNRGDIGFGNDKIMRWHEASPQRPHYLFKLRMTSNVRQKLLCTPDTEWQGCPEYGVLQVAECRLKLSSWDTSRRVVFGRRLMGETQAITNGQFWDEHKYKFEAYVTDLSLDQANSWQIVDLYRQRADAENVFDELKNQWGFGGFCSKHAGVTEIAARLLLLCYDLWTIFSRAMNPNGHTEAKTSRKWHLLIAARLIKSGRQRTMRISVCRDWQEELMRGYRAISFWLNSTAPQLENTAKLLPP
jgi:hypothetical protein